MVCFNGVMLPWKLRGISPAYGLLFTHLKLFPRFYATLSMIGFPETGIVGLERKKPVGYLHRI